MVRDRGLGRGFREVDICITSVQPGAERSARADDEATIYPANWRNNLTGLSQHANLYFVGVSDEIHVYQPEFPTQRLPKRIFAWRVANSDSCRRGFICPAHPHWINRLLVGDCGTEEVIATAHDEGDFIVCTVRSVCQAIEACHAFDMKPQDAADKYLKYLCMRNVGQSAWGLAIHQTARLLAVSSNTQNITVVAPALVQDGHQDNVPSNIKTRDEDKVYLLSGHDANIPCIAFCNTDDDRDGRFLVSTDISGGIIIWDIWKQCGLKKIAMSVGPEDGHLLGENYLGWSVTCVDPRSFRSTSNDVEFVGFCRQNAKKSATTVDVSPARKYLRDFQFWHESDAGNLPARDRLFASQGALTISDDSTDEDDLDEDDDIEDEVAALLQDEQLAILDRWEMFDEWEEAQADDIPDDMYDTIDFGPQPTNPSNPTVEEVSEDADRDEGAVLSLPPTQSLAPISTLNLPTNSRHPPFAPHGRSTWRHWSELPPPPAPKAPEPKFPFAILHSGQRIVTLLRPPFDSAAAVCIDPCHEHLPAAVYSLGSFERLNLTSYIPELGVAVLATQKGRAAIFTLTTMPAGAASDPSPPSSHSRYAPSRPANARSSSSTSDFGTSFQHDQTSSESTARHAMRLDWVIPFKSQENRNQRPWSPLLGITTAPVQGCQSQDNPVARSGEGSHDVLKHFGGATVGDGKGKPGRWRIFLTYADNTVLTYDLFREECNERLLVY